ncbi:unnamed protein product [Rhizoctonia solani]|uniref:Uncharacterized protein n=1 Tax=Rhizoctonia solani TaxID=456999 RepID=A0A8H3DKD5_9AGAM|nr:unnamed protein product [Rhizoctonia solani]
MMGRAAHFETRYLGWDGVGESACRCQGETRRRHRQMGCGPQLANKVLWCDYPRLDCHETSSGRSLRPVECSTLIPVLFYAQTLLSTIRSTSSSASSDGKSPSCVSLDTRVGTRSGFIPLLSVFARLISDFCSPCTNSLSANA